MNTRSRDKICAIIPFFNEKDTIQEIIDRTLPYVDLIICVNDGSTDGSENQVHVSDKVILLSSAVNMGKGYAINMGFIHCFHLNCDIAVTLDADLQHDPRYIPSFISMMDQNDIVIGNRLSDISNMPLQRIMSNKITSFLLSLKTHTKILDSQCGFRAYRTEKLRKILPVNRGFEAESEIIIHASRNNCRIGFVNIPTIYGSENSKMRPWEAIAGFIRILFL
ncbi:MAG: glycosyltransferase family 2 protein [Ignavibacteriales bacterium]